MDNPSWWQNSADDCDEIGALARFFPSADAAPKDDDASSEVQDDGLAGVPDLHSYNQAAKDLQEIDKKIAELTKSLRDNGISLAQNMDEDDDQMHKKKRFMTIADLPRSPLFTWGDSGAAAAVDNRPEAVIDVGRRLKDGAHLPAVHAPVLGFATPIYIKDAVGPCLLLLLLVSISMLCLLLQNRRLQRELRNERQRSEVETEASRRVAALLQQQQYVTASSL